MSHKIESQSVNQKSSDLRVRRTEMMLQQSFMDLVVEVGFNAITVQMLAERAMINRATFYRHYDDIFDLAEKIYLNLAQEYRESVQSFMPGSPIETFTKLFEHCGEYSAYYLALLSEMPRSQEFVQDMIERETAAFFKGFGLDETKMTTPLPVVLRFWSITQLGLVRWWLEDGQAIPPREMAQHLWQLLEKGAIESLQLPLPPDPAP